MDVYAPTNISLIRSATEADLDRVLEIDQLSFPAPWTPHLLKISLREIFFIIERKEVLGYLIACLCDLGLRAQILRIAVHPDHRGKGVAKELLKTTLRVFAKNYVKEVALYVNSANRSAENLYESFGFKITESFPFLDDQDFDIFHEMKLELLEEEVEYRELERL